MAYRYLGQRDYAGQELQRKLENRGAQPEQAAAAIDQLIENGFLSDARFAEVFTRYRVAKGFGPTRIRADLRQRGVKDALIAEALLVYEDEWYDRAKEFIHRKHKGELDQKAKARLYRSGLSRGYSHDQVMRGLETLQDH